jgi:hypothetical protein
MAYKPADEEKHLQGRIDALEKEAAQSRAEAAEAFAAARYAQDEAAIAAESIAFLRQDLAAAQMRTARALAEAHVMNENVETLRATRTYRHALLIQSTYERLRRSIRSRMKPRTEA